MKQNKVAQLKEMAILAAAGGLGFWAANFTISRTPIAAEYRAALSISYVPMLLESLVGGLIIGTCVSYLLARFFEKLPTKNPISKSVLLSFIVLIMVTLLMEAPAKFLTPTNDALRYFLIGTMFNLIRILTLGIVIGYLYDRINGRVGSKKEKRKNILTFVIILMAMAGCTAPQTQAAPEPAATGTPQAEMPNPASVYCKENGNRLEIRTAPDGSQSGVCVFPGGSTCDEWAYYRGECGPARPATEASSSDPGGGGGTGENGPDGSMTPDKTEEISDLNDNNSHGLRVTNIGDSNSGFMITTSHKKILIDALFRGIKGVYTLPEDTQNLLGLAQTPFDNVDLILVTHSHRDHFDIGLVRQHLQNDPKAVIASQPSIISQFSTFADQIVNLDPTPGEPVQTDIDEIHVEALALSHGPGQPGNIGFVITIDGIKLFFTGDMDTSQISFEEFRAYKLPEEKIDIAFIPHFYLTDIPSDQQFVKEGIAAKYIIPMHYYFTDPPMDPITVLRNYPDAIFFNEELSNWIMP